MYTKIILLFTIFSCITTNVSGQIHMWHKIINGEGQQNIIDIKRGSDESLYIIGQFHNESDFDPSEEGESLFDTDDYPDLFILKLNHFGEFQWVKTLGNNSYAQYVNFFQMDADDNLYLCGGFSGTLDFDPNEGIHNESAPPISLYVLKLNSEGEFQYVRTFPGIKRAEDFDVDENGNIMVIGKFNLERDFDPSEEEYLLSNPEDAGYTPYILRLNASGEFQWVKGFFTDHIILSAVKFDNDNNPIVTGTLIDSIVLTIDGTANTLTSNGESDGCFFKLSTTGDIQQFYQVGGINAEYFRDIIIDKNGNFLVYGYYHNVTDFDPSDATFELDAGDIRKTFIAKYNALGEFIWVIDFKNPYSGSKLHTLNVDQYGDLYLTLNFKETIDMDPSEAVKNLASTDGVNPIDAAVAKYNGETGALLWAGKFGFTNLDEVNGSILDNVGNIYLVGNFNKKCDFDILPGPLHFNTEVVDGSNDGFIVKYRQDLVSTPTYPTDEINLYPNPVQDVLTLKLDASHDNSAIAIYNLQGQLQQQFIVQSGQQETIDVKNLASGTYVLTITSEKETLRTQFVKI